ncbi:MULTISPECIES: GAF and ANTAR domain-containing protein [Cryobacterium]|uniref:GAF and ANTAR domain-containing protein n=1 Tax=Cryobacterium TaxID=69578 RepID=UPI000CD498DF|nr:MULTISPECIES: GAF and ANTAR domain-containing protein [Cryobacterium]POH66058.1 transcriptional regulator [Cryobacterium zongtaii]TFC46724.1 ANTAR domain-containing protein [Cryobacterium sp. TMN-39-2]
MVFSQREVDLADVFVLLADSLSAGRDVVDTMDILVQASTEFTAATDAGILLADSGGVLHIMASSNERTSEVEEAQLGHDQGPCLDCFASGEPVEISNLSEVSGRWPQFVAIARERGFDAAHSFPLRLRGDTFGSLNLFSSTREPFSIQDAALALALAQVATISLVQHQAIRNQGTVNGQLQQALKSRILIEQAKSVLAQRHGVPIDAAFSLLRTYARTSSSKLHDIADGVVHHGLSF